MPEPLADPLSLLLLAVAGLAAGIINTLAGGGSFLTLPALIFFGLPAGVANGTNRLSVLVQSLVATGTFARGGERPFAHLLRLAPAPLLGAIAGAFAATRFPGDAFRPILGGVLLLMGALAILKPHLLDASPTPRPAGPGTHLSLLLIGAYGGFVQAGVGLLLLSVLLGLLGHGLVRANALKVALVAAFTAISLLLFGAHGQVAWLPGAALAIGAALGGLIGARLALRVEARWLRFVVAAVALGSGAHLLLP